MRNDEAQEFRDLISSTFEVFGVTTSANALTIWWNALAPYSLEQVRAALSQHVQTSVYAPKPADVISFINAHDGRPGSEEAWAIALRASDEAETVIWTDEIAEAWGVAREILDAGDEVGARMAFRERYERSVAEARRRQESARWTVSLGHDPDRRQQVVRDAVDQGAITHHQAVAMLGHDPSGTPDAAPQLEHQGDDDDADDDNGPVSAEEARANLRYLRELIQGVGGDEADAIEIDDEQRERTAAWGDRRVKEEE